MADKLDRLKDLLGIYDDAGDFVDSLKDILKDIEPLVKQLERAGSAVLSKIEAARRSGDAKTVGRIVDSLDVKSPVLYGKTIREKLAKALAEVRNLESKLRKTPTHVKVKVAPRLRAVKQEILSVLRDNQKAIDSLSDVQRQTRSAGRRKLVGALTLTAAAASAGAIGYLIGYSARVSLIRVFGTVVSGMIRSATEGLDSIHEDLIQEHAATVDVVSAMIQS